ncbi:hypothetical protein ACH4UT_23485 [Streptomyces sp. NPDC020799]|uniref:hypothetical protein n=1 Tax=Streptomyces sp. NPDC020799 TaxID=3365091 RepID=UPI00348C6D82
MADLTKRAATTAAPQRPESAKTPKKRKAILWGVIGAVCAATTTGLLLWKPWVEVDRSPFTALIGNISEDEYLRSGGKGHGGDQCTPNQVGERVIVFDKSGKRKLAEGVAERTGERLPDSYGEVAGYCFSVTRIEGVPGGEGTYVTQVGGGNKTKSDEKDLRRTVQEHREAFKNMRLPAADAPIEDIE